MTNNEENINIYLSSVEYVHKLETLLATKLGLTNLSSGNQVIRDEKGFRENEKIIEYIWLVTIARSFVGWGALFSIKFTENIFRDHSNPTELVQGLFIYNQDGISKIYIDNKSDTMDKVAETFKFNLLEVNKGIILDGTGYNLRIIANNIDTFIRLHNPNTEEWLKWETEIFKMGRELALKANDEDMIHLFK